MKYQHTFYRPWMKTVLLAAAVYNVVWGSLVVLFPHFWFDVLGVIRPNYPELWQCIGMIVGVYGIGYGIDAFAPLVHWPIVLVGFLGKIFGPLGYLYGVWQGTWPASFGWLNLTNDLIWLIPFFLILRAAWKNFIEEPELLGSELHRALAEATTSSGKTLLDMSKEKPLLLIFLRHFGCCFCKDSIHQAKAMRDQLNSEGKQLAFVHPGEDGPTAQAFFEKYGWPGVVYVSDPEAKLYRAFSLKRGKLSQLFSWRNVREALRRKLFQVGLPHGDPFRMSGVFLVQNGEIIYADRHNFASDQTDYDKLSSHQWSCQLN
ncbi:MAG TPA: AhpC/TSA family protein [Gemmatales bacterium]|nr:AhpC/TSA family protein [Gemmatales bacterium]